MALLIKVISKGRLCYTLLFSDHKGRYTHAHTERETERAYANLLKTFECICLQCVHVKVGMQSLKGHFLSEFRFTFQQGAVHHSTRQSLKWAGTALRDADRDNRHQHPPPMPSGFAKPKFKFPPNALPAIFLNRFLYHMGSRSWAQSD